MPPEALSLPSACAVLVLVGAAVAAEPDAGATRPASRAARDELLFVGAAAGATAAWSVGRDAGGTWLPLAGGAAGAGASWLAVRGRALPAHAGARGASLAAAGTWTGWQAGRLACPDTSPPCTGARWLLAGGDLAGATTGIALAAHPAGSARDWWLADAGLAVGWGFGAGAGGLLDGAGSPDPRRAAALELAGGALGMAVALAGREAWDAEPERAALWAVHGTWLGEVAVTAFAENPSDRQRLGGRALGAATGGLAAGIARAHPTTVPALAWSAAWTVTGATVGGGVYAAAWPDLPVEQGGLALGSLAGEIVGAVTWNPERVGPGGDAWMATMGQGWAVLDGGAWAVWAQQGWPDEPSLPLAAGLLGYGLTSAWSLGLPALADYSVSQALAVQSAAAWGHWFGGVGGLALGLEAGPHAAWTAGLGGLAHAAGGAVAAGGWDPSARATWLANGGGALGAIGGAAVAVLVERDLATLSAGALLGSAGGLGAGALLGRRSRGEVQALLPRPHLPFQVALAPSPWRDSQGRTGIYVEAQLAGRRR